MILSPISDYLNNKGHLSVEVSRKLFNSIGLWGPMTALLALAYVPKGSVELAVALLTMAVGINSATYLGFQVNHIDLGNLFRLTSMSVCNKKCVYKYSSKSRGNNDGYHKLRS